MGFYFRKSINVGGLRFNLSKSGIGMSTGIRGFRVGTGPHGNYVSMGMGGIYYRKTFPHSTGQGAFSSPSTANNRRSPSVAAPITTATLGATTIVDSADASRMVDSNSADLLAEINHKNSKIALFPFALGASFLILLFIVLTQIPWLVVLAGILCIAGCALAKWRDILKKTVVLFYDLDPVAEQAYQTLHNEANRLSQCGSLWNIRQSTAVTNQKYHAGASTLINRDRIRLGTKGPSILKTNIQVVSIPAGRQTLYLFPDRILVVDDSGVGAIAYGSVSCRIAASTFIESGSVPFDAVIVDRTWRYVNKNGGPDRRFANNSEIPICRYEDMQMTSPNGLNELFEASKQGLWGGFANAMHTLGQVANRAQRGRHPAPQNSIKKP